jgi:hypothetical protein
VQLNTDFLRIALIKAFSNEFFNTLIVISSSSMGEKEDTVEEGVRDGFEGFWEVWLTRTEGEGFDDCATFGGRVETVLHD